MELVRRDALLARVHQVVGQHPLVQRDVRTLEHRPDRHRELTMAVVALKQALAVRGTFKARDLHGAAVRAGRAVGPAHAFQMSASRVLVVEDGVREINHSPSPRLS